MKEPEARVLYSSMKEPEARVLIMMQAIYYVLSTAVLQGTGLFRVWGFGPRSELFPKIPRSEGHRAAMLWLIAPEGVKHLLIMHPPKY